MQDMILSEVLDSSSGVRWSDIAGLATAKQASRACDCTQTICMQSCANSTVIQPTVSAMFKASV